MVAFFGLRGALAQTSGGPCEHEVDVVLKQAAPASKPAP